ncbi:MAG: HEAT repeat domain-containing protein [Anaerolineales bacterium]
MTDEKSIQRLWRSLEERALPEAADLPYLSGLLQEESERFGRLWAALPLNIRRELITFLSNLAEADFEMDFTAIFRIAMYDADPKVRATAIAGLFEDQDVRLAPQFIHILHEAPDDLTRVACIQALGNFILWGELQKIRPRPFDRVRKALIAIYQAPEASLAVRRQAIESLSYTGLDDVPEMIAAAYEHGSEELRISAVFAMGRSADDRWAEIVTRELANPNPAMRHEATRACGELQLRSTTRELIELVEDVNLEIQTTALWALGQIGGDRAKKTLEQYVKSKDKALREAAHDALSELEFFYGDLSSFFGPPMKFPDQNDLTWAEEDELARHAEDENEEDDLPW